MKKTVSFILIFFMLLCMAPSGFAVGAEPESVAIVGSGLSGISEWDPADPNGDMTEIADNVFQITLPATAGVEMWFKFVGNDAWHDEYNYGGETGAVSAGQKYTVIVSGGSCNFHYTPESDGTATFTLDLTAYVAGTGDTTLYIDAMPDDEDETATITFDDISKRISLSIQQQVWEEDGITFVNDKASSASSIANYYNPIRCYRGSSITISCLRYIEKIIFTCDDYKDTYVTELVASITNATVVADGLVVTVTPHTLSDFFIIEKLTNQVRINSIKVIQGGDAPKPDPEPVIPEPDSMAIVGDGLPGIQAWNPADLNGDMTKISDYVYEITLPVEAGAEMVFKFAGNGMWDDNYILGGTAGLIGEKVCLVAGSGALDITYLPDTDGDMTFTLDLTPYLTGTGDATLLITASWECDGHQYANGVCMYCGRSEMGGITVYFQNTDGWDVPYIYTWAHQSDYIALYNGHWPGEPMKKVSGTEDIYYMPLVKNVEELVFSNAGNSPTADLTVPGDDLVLFDCETQSWLAYKPPCTHPKHDTSGNCTACGEVVEHSYVDGFCTVCGSEKILIPPTITLQYITLLLEDEIKLNVNFSVDQNIALDKMGLLTWVAKPDVVDISTADGVIAGVTHDATQGIYGVTTMGIPAQNLGDMIYFCVYAEMEDGTFVYGKQAQYSPTTYAYNKLNGNADAQTKALYVTILNYGAAAQTFLGDTDSLINANLTAEQRSLAEVYRTDMVHTVDKVNAVKQGNLIGNGGFTKLQPTIALGEAFSINYYFTPVYNVIGNMTFYYWNAEDFAAVDVLSIENATGSVVMANENGVYGGAAIDGISAKNINSALYACGVYTDANGNTYSTGILPYSLGFYCGNQVNAGGETADLAAAIAVYGYYAAAYFA